MSSVWQPRREYNWLWGAAGSAALHAALAAFLFLLPAEARDRLLNAVDFSVQKRAQTPPEPEPPAPPPEVEPEQVEVEQVDTRPRAAKRPAEPEVEPETPPEPPPKPPPKFTMSGQTFADEGSWSLAAEEGDSRFGSLSGAGKYEPGEEEKKPAATSPVGPAAPPPKKPKFAPAKSSQVKEKPKVLLEQTIPYPAEARKLGIEGKVRMRVDIDEKGKVVQVTVLEDPGGGLGKAAAKAIKGFVFTPAVGLDGKPVDYRITYIYVFKLE